MNGDSQFARTARRREEERNRHRRGILRAAEMVFARHGYHKAGMAMIAEEAAFAVGTLYNFFKDKEYLYSELVCSITEEFTARAKEVLRDISAPRKALVELMRLKHQIFAKHREFLRVVFSEISKDYDEARATVRPGVRERYEEYMGVLTEVFREGVRRGEFQRIDPGVLANVFEAITLEYFRHLGRGVKESEMRENLRAAREIFDKVEIAVEPRSGGPKGHSRRT